MKAAESRFLRPEHLERLKDNRATVVVIWQAQKETIRKSTGLPGKAALAGLDEAPGGAEEQV